MAQPPNMNNIPPPGFFINEQGSIAVDPNYATACFSFLQSYFQTIATAAAAPPPIFIPEPIPDMPAVANRNNPRFKLQPPPPEKKPETPQVTSNPAQKNNAATAVPILTHDVLRSVFAPKPLTPISTLYSSPAQTTFSQIELSKESVSIPLTDSGEETAAGNDPSEFFSDQISNSSGKRSSDFQEPLKKRPQSLRTSVTDSDNALFNALTDSIEPSKPFPSYFYARQTINYQPVFRLGVEMGGDVLPNPQDFTPEEMAKEQLKMKTTRKDRTRFFIEDIYEVTKDPLNKLKLLAKANSLELVQALTETHTHFISELISNNIISSDSSIAKTVHQLADRTYANRRSVPFAKLDAKAIMEFQQVYEHAKDKMLMLVSLGNYFEELRSEIRSEADINKGIYGNIEFQQLEFEINPLKARCVVTNHLGTLDRELRGYQRAHILPIASFEIIIKSAWEIDYLNPELFNVFNKTITLHSASELKILPMYAFLNMSQPLPSQAEDINTELEVQLRASLADNIAKILSGNITSCEMVSAFRDSAMAVMRTLDPEEFDESLVSAFLAGLQDSPVW